METERLALYTDQIETHSLWAWWHKNDQIGCYQERKDVKCHGEYKHWALDGRLRSHNIYENGEWIKRIL